MVKTSLCMSPTPPMPPVTLTKFVPLKNSNLANEVLNLIMPACGVAGRSAVVPDGIKSDCADPTLSCDETVFTNLPMLQSYG